MIPPATSATRPRTIDRIGEIRLHRPFATLTQPSRPMTRDQNDFVGGRRVDTSTIVVDHRQSGLIHFILLFRRQDAAHSLSLLVIAQHVQLPSRPPSWPSIARAQLHTGTGAFFTERTQVRSRSHQGSISKEA